MRIFINKIRTWRSLSLGIIISLSMHNCNDKKEYKYVEKIKDSNKSKTVYKTKSFHSANDTLAYIEAYRRFKASQNVSSFSKNKIRDKYFTPVDFELLRNETDISNIEFQTKSKQKEKIDFQFSRIAKDHSRQLSYEEVAELKNVFNYKKIDQGSEIFIQKDNDWDKETSLYGYMIVQDNYLKSFRLKFSATVDDLVLPYECNIIINGKRFEINRVSLDGSLSKNKEGFDDDISKNVSLIQAISEANFIEIEMIGRRFTSREKISDMHLFKLKQAISTYLQLINKF